MSAVALRRVVEITAILLWSRHFGGAARAFKPVQGEQPSPTLNLFPLAALVLSIETFREQMAEAFISPGLLCFAGSLALFEWARHSIQGKFFSYMNSNDTPQFICASGPFAYIRNPFYASYLLSYIGVAIMFPGIITLAVVLGMFLFLVHVARHEERKFARSPVATEYEAYRRRTGRFIPRFRS
jgi:protein-S-isoprenylcysteine O-methyltransferase Ste14